MTDTKRTRAELKSFFEASDIPTQSEFDDLITTMATQLGTNVFSEDTQTFQGSVAVLSGVSAAYFYGDGTFLTNISKINIKSIGTQSTTISAVTGIEFDSDTGFQVTESSPKTARISLGSHWKTLIVQDQDSLIPSGEESLELIAGTNTTIITNSSTTPQSLTFNAKAGATFITNIAPQNLSTDNVGNKVFTSDGIVLSACETTTDLITVSALALPGTTNYKPSITIKNTPVPLTIIGDGPLFKGVVNIDLNSDELLTVNHEDGASHTVIIKRDQPITILTATFTGSYPGAQTELKAGDTFSVFVSSDLNFVKIQIDNYGAFTNSTHDVSSTDQSTVTGTIANRGTTSQNLGAKIRVQKASGTWSEWFLTESLGSTDGVNLVTLNNTYPSITFTTTNYPASQQAIKTSESATINHTVTNFDTILYSSPTNELTISNNSTYETNKTVTFDSGTYNVTTNNFRVVATKSSNNAQTTNNTVVKIAAVEPTININITGNPTRLRSGGNDGTSPQNYTVNVVSNQQLIASPTLSAGQGTFQGAGFAGGPSNWTRTLTIHDDDTKGSYVFSSLSATGLAGLEQTTISSGAAYTLGGFVSRNISLPAFGSEAVMNVAAQDYTKVVLTWSFDSQLTIRESVDTLAPVSKAWCLLSPITTAPVTIRLLDSASVNSSSQTSTITIQETV